MPRVQVYGVPQVRQSPVADVALRPVQSDAGRVVGGALENFGNDLSRVAQNEREMTQMLQQREQQRQAAIDAAATTTGITDFNNFRRTRMFGDANTPGYQALQGADAINGREGVEKDLNGFAEQIIARGTPRQQQLLRKALQDPLNSALNQTDEHASKELGTYQQQSLTSAVESAKSDAAAYYDKPDEQAKAMERVRQGIYGLGHFNGWDADTVNVNLLKATSSIHDSALKGMIKVNPNQAADYFQAHYTEMTGDDRNKWQADLGVATIEQGATSNAQSKLSGATSGAGSVPGGTVTPDLIAGQESGNLPADKQVSSKGALGSMGIMPDTGRQVARALAARGDAEMAKVAALPEAELRKRLQYDKDLNRKIGTEYYRQRRDARGGSEVLALADYNAGPGRTDAWLKSIGDPRTGQISEAEFAARIPFKETRDYVQGIIGKAGGASQGVSAKTDLAGRYEAALAEVRATYKGDPVRLKAYEDALGHEYTVQKGIVDGHMDAAWDSAQPLRSATSMAALTSDPRYLALDPQHRRQLDEEVGKNAEKAATAAQERAHAQLILGGGGIDPNDPAMKKAVETEFVTQAQSWGRPGTQGFNANAVNFASRAGMVPGTLQGIIRGGLRSTDANVVIGAANTLDQLNTANPELMRDFSQDDISLANRVITHAAAGLGGQDAVAEAKALARMAPQEREAKAVQYAGLIKSKPTANYLDDEVKKRAGAGWQFWRGNPQTTAQMAADFDLIAKDEYARYGNFDAARKTAMQAVWSVYGRSDVTGSPVIMKRPPEKFFGAPNLSQAQNAKWIADQLYSEMFANTMTDRDPHGHITLQPHPTSPVDARGLPVYAVMLQWKDGTIHALSDGKGGALAWQPNWNSSKEKKAQDAERQGKVDQARQLRKSMRAPVTDDQLRQMGTIAAGAGL